MKHRAFIFIILAGVLWGSSGIFVQLLAPYGFTAPQMTFFRALISAISLAIYILLFDRRLFRTSGKDLLLFAASGISFFGTATCYYFSMQATSVSTAVVLMYTAPVLVMLYSVAFLGEKRTALKTVSVIAMLVGCGLVSGIIGGLRFDLFGILIGLLAGISYSAYNIVTKIQMRRGCAPITATLYSFVFASVLALLTCNAASIPRSIALAPAVTLPLLAALGICTCVLPYFFYTVSLKVLPAGTASALAIVEPMAATVFSVLLFGEPLGLPAICGIILILGAVFLLSKNEE